MKTLINHETIKIKGKMKNLLNTEISTISGGINHCYCNHNNDYNYWNGGWGVILTNEPNRCIELCCSGKSRASWRFGINTPGRYQEGICANSLHTSKNIKF